MNENIYGSKQGNRRSIREIHHNQISGQASVERQFQKPGADRNSANLDRLYFREGPTPQHGTRVNPTKNFSSNMRVFGLEDGDATKIGKRQYG